MWFKNLVLFRNKADRNFTAESVHEALSPFAFRSCGRLDFFTYGWEAPLGKLGQLLAHEANGCILLSARKEERLLPAAVVREALSERVEAIEAEQGRPVRRRERDALRDEIVHDFLPRAFTRSNRTQAILAPASGWLIVDAATPKKAEEFTALLAQSLPGFEIRNVETQHSAMAVMTQWLQDGVPAAFQLKDECELRDPVKQGGVVRCRGVDLNGDEVDTHLRAGRQAAQIAMQWEDRMSFLICSDLSVKRLRFEAVDEGDASELDDPLARFDADFAFMSLEILHFLPVLLDAFGGEKQD